MNYAPVERQRRKIIASRRFWSEKSVLLKELGAFLEEIDNVRPQ